MNTFFRYFSKVVILCIIVFLVDFFTGELISHFYFTQKSGPDFKLTYIIDRSKEDMLFIGSSRSTYHYIPNLFQDSLHISCINTGRDGIDILYNNAILKCVLKRYSPKYIVLDVTERDFIYFESGIGSYERLLVLLPYYRTHKNEIEEIVNLKSKYEKIKLTSRMYPFNSKLISILNGNLNTDKNPIQDFDPLYGTIKDKEEVKPTLEGEVDSNKVKAFRDFLSQVKKTNTKLFVVVSPYYNPIYNTTIHIASQIAQEMNTTFWDYSNDSKFFQNKNLFFDAQHLNKDGAELFSRMICKRISQTVNNK